MSENEKKQTPAAAAADDENHIIAERRAKLGDAVDPNTSKKKLAAKEKAEKGQ